jgi:hypothetical protein
VDALYQEKVDELKLCTDMQAGMEILHLFVVDLLGRHTPATKIFQGKTDEDFRHSMVVTKTDLVASTMLSGCIMHMYFSKCIITANVLLTSTTGI